MSIIRHYDGVIAIEDVAEVHSGKLRLNVTYLLMMPASDRCCHLRMCTRPWRAQRQMERRLVTASNTGS